MIATGMILMERDTPHPACFHLSQDADASSWTTVTHNFGPPELAKELSEAKWTFFYIAGEIKTMAFGFQRPKMLRAAFARTIAAVKLQHCNCVEIDTVTAHSFLGLPYTRISAHARHIQKGTHSIQREKGA
jgi:hypothetical protein